MGDRWGLRKGSIEKNGKCRMRKEEVRRPVKNTESVWFLGDWTVQARGRVDFPTSLWPPAQVRQRKWFSGSDGIWVARRKRGKRG